MFIELKLFIIQLFNFLSFLVSVLFALIEKWFAYILTLGLVIIMLKFRLKSQTILTIALLATIFGAIANVFGLNDLAGSVLENAFVFWIFGILLLNVKK